MTFSARLAWSPDLLGYDFGAGHPMSPVRLDLTIELAGELGLLDLPAVDVVDVQPAPDEVLGLIHEPEYLRAVRAASEEGRPDPVRGLDTSDVPIFPGMHEAAARIVAGTRAVAEAVWSGEATHGVNISGGMHHAMAGAAAGFCVYDDASVAIQTLLDSGAKRVAYVDLDAHHGDGVERAFWNDPRVLTVSVHQSGATLFPGTGFPTDTGGPAAKGGAVNLGFPPGTTSAQWLRGVDAVVPEVLREFEPEILVTQHGCDSHGEDPLSDLRVGVAAQRLATSWMHELAHELAGGRWVALGGGGYAVTQVVPFAWSHVLAIAAHAPLADDAPVPPAWRERTMERTEMDVPATMSGGDGPEDGAFFTPWTSGFDPADDVDRAIQATRLAVFPLLGIHHEAF